jgi:quercetin dioxygenase-like cupin family protein
VPVAALAAGIPWAAKRSSGNFAVNFRKTFEKGDGWSINGETDATTDCPRLDPEIVLSAGLTGTAQQPLAPGALIVGSGDRPAVASSRGCGSIRFLVNSEDTAGAFSIVEGNECETPMTDLHRHPDMDEAFYVVEGTLTVYADGKTHVLGPGSYFFVPRGTPHAQGNPCPVPNKVLVTFTPGGFERYLRDRNELLRTTTIGSPEFQAGMKARGHAGTGPGGRDGLNNLGKAPVDAVSCPSK